eukprot:gene6115-5968_t
MDAEASTLTVTCASCLAVAEDPVGAPGCAALPAAGTSTAALLLRWPTACHPQ